MHTHIVSSLDIAHSIKLILILKSTSGIIIISRHNIITMRTWVTAINWPILF